MSRPWTPTTPGASAREIEEALLKRCLSMALNDEASQAADQREAHVFFFIGRAITSMLPTEGARLERAGREWRSRNPEKQINLQAVAKSGWLLGVPRFRDMLIKRIQFTKRQSWNSTQNLL